MISYILKTLQIEDHVFIERLGSFRLNLCHAKIEGETIQPPHYEVLFEQTDSEENNFALSNLISREQQCLFTQANEQVTAWVGELLTALQHNKSVAYEDFGSFMLDKKGNITFESAVIPQLNTLFEGMEPIDIKRVGVDLEPVETFSETSIQSEPEPVETLSETLEQPEQVETFSETSLQSEPEPVETLSETLEQPEQVETFFETSLQSEPEPVETLSETLEQPEQVETLSETLEQPEQVETFSQTSLQPEPEPVETSSETLEQPEQVETFSETSIQSEPEPVEISSITSEQPEPEPLVNDDDEEEYDDDDDDDYDDDEEEKKHHLAWLWILLLLLAALAALGFVFKDKLLNYYHEWKEKKQPVEQVVEPQEPQDDATTTFEETTEPEVEEVVEPEPEPEPEPEVFTPEVIKQSADGKYDYIRFEKGHYYAIAGSFPKESDVIRHIHQKNLDQYSPKILKQDGAPNLRVCIGVFDSESEAESFAKGVNASYWVLK